jgi:hypothetical protein
MPAQQNSLRVLRENFAFQIASDQQNSNLFGNARASPYGFKYLG